MLSELNNLQKFITGMILIRLSYLQAEVELSESVINHLVDAEDLTNAQLARETVNAKIDTLSATERNRVINLLCDILFVEREEEESETFRIDDDIEREYKLYTDAEDGETI